MAFVNNILVKDVDTVEEGIGFKLPFTLSDGNMSTTTLESVQTNLTNLLLTEKGQRLFQPNLGVDIRGNLFEPIIPESFASLQDDILQQIAIWLPFLEVSNIKINPEADNNLVRVEITYGFKNNPELTDSVQVDLNTGASY